MNPLGFFPEETIISNPHVFKGLPRLGQIWYEKGQPDKMLVVLRFSAKTGRVNYRWLDTLNHSPFQWQTDLYAFLQAFSFSH